MGLILSVLVVCVGLCELISFYSKVRRNLTSPPAQGDLASVSDGYIKELRGLRKDIVTNAVAVARLNKNKDAEVEIQTSRCSNGKKLVVVEKYAGSTKQSFPPPTTFSESENLFALKKSDLETSKQKISIDSGKNYVESADEPKYVLQGRKTPIEVSVQHSPQQFTEHDDDIDTIVSRNTLYEAGTQRERSLSPFPPLDLPQVPRNSVCQELSTIGEICIDQSRSRSPTPSGRVDVILENTSFNTTQYWTNKVLVVPSRKSALRSPSPNLQNAIVPAFLEAPKPKRIRSKSESNHQNASILSNDVKKAASNLGLSDEFEWSFPLELEEETSPYEINSGYRENAENAKRKTTGLENTNFTAQDSFNNKKTIAVLTDAAEELKKVSSKEKSPSSDASEASDSKHKEPFWVKT